MSEVRPLSTPRPVRVFISHSERDHVYAQKVRNLLRRTNAEVFATDDLSAGEEWESKLRNALAAADVVVAILTPMSVQSNWVLYELGAAWGLGKPIIPVVSRREVLNNLPIALENAEPLHLQDVESPASADKFVSAFENSLAAVHVV